MDTGPTDLAICRRNAPGAGGDLSAVAVRFSRPGGGGNARRAGPPVGGAVHDLAGAHRLASGAGGGRIADFLPPHHAGRHGAAPDLAARDRDCVFGRICGGQCVVGFIARLSNSLAAECVYYVDLIYPVPRRTTARAVCDHGPAGLDAVRSADRPISLIMAVGAPRVQRCSAFPIDTDGIATAQ